jgi:endonuclease/exonuclease/phosphatase (EEP) superfamily protein YafD
LLAVAILTLVPIQGWPPNALNTFLLTAVAFAGLWQLSWIWRYLPVAPREVPAARGANTHHGEIRLLTTNVCQKSRGADSLLTIIRKADPDVILAVETDEWWCARLKDGLISNYPFLLLYPLSNGYGLALFSRFELISPRVRFLVDEAIPSIKAGLRLRSGALIDIYGMHPQPPAPPGQDSTERDVELILVGREIMAEHRPAIVLGDLNDVAWSATTAQFKQTGNLSDPRGGRGFFNTYPAGMPGLRYPLDYIFHTRHFRLCTMRVLPKFESDHLPLFVALSLHEN